MLFHAHRPQPITTNFSSWLLLASFLYSDIPSTSFKYATHVHAARSVLLLGTFSYLVFVLPGCGHVRACSTLSTCLLVFGDEYTTLCLLPCHLSPLRWCFCLPTPTPTPGIGIEPDCCYSPVSSCHCVCVCARASICAEHMLKQGRTHLHTRM